MTERIEQLNFLEIIEESSEAKNKHSDDVCPLGVEVEIANNEEIEEIYEIPNKTMIKAPTQNGYASAKCQNSFTATLINGKEVNGDPAFKTHQNVKVFRGVHRHNFGYHKPGGAHWTIPEGGVIGAPKRRAKLLKKQSEKGEESA